MQWHASGNHFRQGYNVYLKILVPFDEKVWHSHTVEQRQKPADQWSRGAYNRYRRGMSKKLHHVQARLDYPRTIRESEFLETEMYHCNSLMKPTCTTK